MPSFRFASFRAPLRPQASPSALQWGLPSFRFAIFARPPCASAARGPLGGRAQTQHVASSTFLGAWGLGASSGALAATRASSKIRAESSRALQTAPPGQPHPGSQGEEHCSICATCHPKIGAQLISPALDQVLTISADSPGGGRRRRVNQDPGRVLAASGRLLAGSWMGRRIPPRNIGCRQNSTYLQRS